MYPKIIINCVKIILIFSKVTDVVQAICIYDILLYVYANKYKEICMLIVTDYICRQYMYSTCLVCAQYVDSILIYRYMDRCNMCTYMGFISMAYMYVYKFMSLQYMYVTHIYRMYVYAAYICVYRLYIYAMYIQIVYL